MTAIASVKRGSVGLAIGDIVGGNALDTMMVAVADVAYLEGSVFRAVTSDVTFVAATTVLMTAVLGAGQIRREEADLANIGVESYLVAAVYLAGVLTVLSKAGLLL